MPSRHAVDEPVGLAPVVARLAARHRARLPLRRPARGRCRDADLPLLLAGEEARRGTRRSSATAPSRAWPGPEAANNASAAGTLVTLLALGIPTTATAAVMLSAFQRYDLQPGPQLLREHPRRGVGTAGQPADRQRDAAGAQPAAGARCGPGCCTLPRPYLYSGILFFSILGSYSVNQNPTDILVLVVLGLLGFLMRRYGLPVVPTVIGVILGPTSEGKLRQALQVSNGDWSTLWGHRLLDHHVRRDRRPAHAGGRAGRRGAACLRLGGRPRPRSASARRSRREPGASPASSPSSARNPPPGSGPRRTPSPAARRAAPGGDGHGAAVAHDEDALPAVQVADLVQHARHPAGDHREGLAPGDRRRVVARHPGAEDRPQRRPTRPRRCRRAPRRRTPAGPRGHHVDAQHRGRDLGGLHGPRQGAGPDPRDPLPAEPLTQAAGLGPPGGAERPAVVGDQVRLVVGLAVAGEEERVVHCRSLMSPR